MPESVIACAMRGKVATMEEGALPESPLKPLKNSLCLIKALGLPLRIEGEDGTIVRNKSSWAFIAILFLPLLMSMCGWVGNAFLSKQLLEKRGENIDKWTHDKGFQKWDNTSTFLFVLALALLPFVYFYCYRGLGPKFEKFIQHYQRTFLNLKIGKHEVK